MWRSRTADDKRHDGRWPNPGIPRATVTGIADNAEGTRIPKTLEIISGIDQAGLPGDALEKAFVVEVHDQTDKPFPGVEVTFTVTAGGGSPTRN